MLYPTATIALSAMPTLNLLAASSLLVIPLTLAPATALVCVMLQAAPTQDFSLRGWVSLQPCGGFLPTTTSFWHFDRTDNRRIVIYDVTASLPNDLGTILAVALLPGDYYLNILNLVNGENVFSFSSEWLELG